MNSLADTREHYDQVFEKIDLEPGEVLTGEFTDCEFVQCAFASAVLSNCRFFNCTFLECDLSLIQISGSSFPATRFEKSKLIGINWTLGNWSQAEFNPLVGFFDCVISHSTFIGLELPGLQIQNCMAHEVDFRETNLSKVNFQGTDLGKSLFGSTDLTAADLSQARNYQIDPGLNKLKKAKFSLPEAMALLYSMNIEIIETDGTAW